MPGIQGIKGEEGRNGPDGLPVRNQSIFKVNFVNYAYKKYINIYLLYLHIFLFTQGTFGVPGSGGDHGNPGRRGKTVSWILFFNLYTTVKGEIKCFDIPYRYVSRTQNQVYKLVSLLISKTI